MIGRLELGGDGCEGPELAHWKEIQVLDLVVLWLAGPMQSKKDGQTTNKKSPNFASIVREILKKRPIWKSVTDILNMCNIRDQCKMMKLCYF